MQIRVSGCGTADHTHWHKVGDDGEEHCLLVPPSQPLWLAPTFRQKLAAFNEISVACDEAAESGNIEPLIDKVREGFQMLLLGVKM